MALRYSTWFWQTPIYWHHNHSPHSPLCSQCSLGIAGLDCSSGTQRALQADQVFALGADLTGRLKVHSWLPRFKKVTSKLKLPGLHQWELQSFRLLVFQHVSTCFNSDAPDSPDRWLMMPHDAWWAILVGSVELVESVESRRACVFREMGQWWKYEARNI